MLKDQFKAALADILFTDEIDKICRAAGFKDRRRLRAFEQAVKETCHMDRRQLERISMVQLSESIPTVGLWQGVMYKMIANDARERFLDGDELP